MSGGGVKGERVKVEIALLEQGQIWRCHIWQMNGMNGG